MPLAELFAELQTLVEAENVPAVLGTCDKILRLAPNDPDALNAKVVAYIRLEQYANALKLLDAEETPAELRDELLFEKAYCLYRLHRLHECLRFIAESRSQAGGENVERSLSHLEAQVLYRMEDYRPCFDIYSALDRDADEAERAELRANWLAVTSAAIAQHVTVSDEMEIDHKFDSYEIAYNNACSHLANGKLELAADLLVKAKDGCRSALAEAGYSEEEIEQELRIVVLQYAYVRQMQGKSQEALGIYQGILQTKDLDASIHAVAANNLVALRKNRELAESAKLLRAVGNSSMEQKLTSVQRRILAINGALLSLYMNKLGEARQKAKALGKEFPNQHEPLLILASVTLQERKTPTKVLEELQQYVEKLPHALDIHLALAQLLIDQSNTNAALVLMQSFYENSIEPERNQPGLISLLVWLYGQVGDVGKAIHVLEEASKFWQTSGVSRDNEKTSLQQLAAFKMRIGRPEEAAKDYEALVKADPSDVESVAGLIIAYSEFNPSLAEQYQTYLPNEARSGTVHDAEGLEASFSANNPSKRPHPTEPNGQKKKRKRKPKLPKVFDPNIPPDPERWLPKRDRSTFAKKGKGKRDIGKGPQGAALPGGGIGGTGSANIAGPLSPPMKNETPGSNSEATPIQEKPVVLQSSTATNKKKKKGKK